MLGESQSWFAQGLLGEQKPDHSAIDYRKEPVEKTNKSSTNAYLDVCGAVCVDKVGFKVTVNELSRSETW